jgi:Lon-like ATP-dependent protease
MLSFRTTAELAVPQRLIDQVIGQERAVAVVHLAARQRRHVLLIGEPGTGKSLLAQAMSELLPATALHDVLLFPGETDRVSPRVSTVPAGAGREAEEEARVRQRHAAQAIDALFALTAVATIFIALWYAAVRQSGWPLLLGAATCLLLGRGWRYLRISAVPPAPHLLVNNAGRTHAPFVDATGAHAGALLGDVRHDPFQSGGAESPPHRLVEAGALHRAHQGVLFIDEAALLGPESQQALLTALQERRLAITGRNPLSSGAMVRTEPVPCDVVLVLAGNPEDLERIHPALRSRIRGYGYEVTTRSWVEDTEESRDALARFVAQEVRKDGGIPHFDRGAVEALVAEAGRRAGPGRLTARLRELGGLVRAAGDLARSEGAQLVTADHVARARPVARSVEEQLVDDADRAAPPGPGRMSAEGSGLQRLK